jgi:hypothetical protein
MSTDGWDGVPDDLRLIAAIGWDERGPARKRRLYLAALCRRFWEHLDAPTGRAAVEAAEAFVEGRLSVEDVRAAHRAHLQAHVAYATERGKRVARTRRFQFSACALAAADPDGCRLVAVSGRDVVPVAAALLRDVFGHRLEPAGAPGPWRTADVIGLARGIYDERAFDRLPLLADALMDAGCADEAILAHCRTGGPHVRGCWVVDLVLGRE